MFGTDIRKADIGIEVSARHIAEPHRDVGQFGEWLCLLGIGDEAGRIDDDLARIELGMNEIGEHFGQGRSPPFRGQDADTNRTAKLVVQVDAEREVVGQVVIPVRDPLRFRGQDRTLPQVGPVAQMVDLVLFLGGFGEPVVDVLEGIRGALVPARLLQPRTSY